MLRGINQSRKRDLFQTELIMHQNPLMFSETVQWVYMSPHVTFFQYCLLADLWLLKSNCVCFFFFYTTILWGTCASLLVLILILFNSLCLTRNSMQAPRLESFQTILSSPKLGIGFPWNISLLPLGTLPIWPNLFHHWF